MSESRTCRACGNDRVLMTRVAARGGYGPDLLPGVGGRVFQVPRFEMYVCSDCGLVDFVVPQEYLPIIRSSKKWSRV